MTDDTPARVIEADIRPPLKAIAPRMLVTLSIVGILAGIAYFGFTPEGRATIDARGIVATAVGWLIYVVVTLGGAWLLLSVRRALSAGLRPVAKRGIFRLAVIDSLAAGFGAMAATALLAIAATDIMRLLTFALVMVTLFTWATVMPEYATRFTELTGDSDQGEIEEPKADE